MSLYMYMYILDMVIIAVTMTTPHTVCIYVYTYVRYWDSKKNSKLVANKTPTRNHVSYNLFVSTYITILYAPTNSKGKKK